MDHLSFSEIQVLCDNKLLSTELLEFKRKVFIEDKIDMFDWEILNDKDTIIANLINLFTES